MTIPVSNILAQADNAWGAGLAPWPAREDGTKAPLGEWGGKVARRPTREWVAENFRGRTGIGLLTGNPSGGLTLFEFDDAGSQYQAFKEAARATGLGDLLDRLESGYLERSPSGGYHWLYRCATVFSNTKLATGLIETRGDGGYVVIAPSYGNVHPTGKPYVLLAGGFDSIPTITPEEQSLLFALARSFDTVPEKAQSSQASATPPAASGGRPGDAWAAVTDWPAILEPHGWRRLYTRGETTYWRDTDCAIGHQATTNHNASDLLYVFCTSTVFEPQRGYGKFGVYAVLNHGGDFRAAGMALTERGFGERRNATTVAFREPDANREYEADPASYIHSNGHQEPDDDSPLALPEEPVWPDTIYSAAYYGLAGEIVRLIDPCSEADPVALLVNLLVSFGNAANRGTYAIADGARHYLNENAALVGATSKGRKGTSWNHIAMLMQAVDPAWYGNIASGLSSGEGIIYHVRDETRGLVKGKRGEPSTDEIVDPGVQDKRLMIVESELASVLRVVSRDGNTLSPVLRLAWDTGNLRTLTKNNPLKATGAHISLLGHISRDEVRKYLGDVEISNGLANRFLWIAVKRSKVLPEGGGLVNFGNLVSELRDALSYSYSMGEMERDDETREWWAQIYPELSEGKPGMVGSLTARAEAHLLRLEMLYAALDKSRIIRLEHQRAALALWEYSERSVHYIFGEGLGNPLADQINQELETHPDGMTRQEIRVLIGHRARKTEVDTALLLLAKTGRAYQVTDKTTRRPTQKWFPKEQYITISP